MVGGAGGGGIVPPMADGAGGGIVPPMADGARGGIVPEYAVPPIRLLTWRSLGGSARTPCEFAFGGISLVFLENPKVNGKGSDFQSLIQGAWAEMATAMQGSLAHFSKWHRMANLNCLALLCWYGLFPFFSQLKLVSCGH
jgi:hypothetical protein